MHTNKKSEPKRPRYSSVNREETEEIITAPPNKTAPKTIAGPSSLESIELPIEKKNCFYKLNPWNCFWNKSEDSLPLHAKSEEVYKNTTQPNV